MTDRKWRTNPGTRKEARNPTAMLWLRFRCGYESREPRRAGDYNWLARDLPFDIAEAAPVEGFEREMG